MTSIGFIKSSEASFIMKDIEILQKDFEVNVTDTNISTRKPFKTIKSIFNIMKSVYQNDVSYTWFANHHALVMTITAHILRKKSIIVIGGYEVEGIDSIGYGSFANNKKGKTPKLVLKFVTEVLAVSKYSKKLIETRTDKPNVQLVYNSINEYDTKRVFKDKSIITIGNATKTKCTLKGLKIFADISAKLYTVKATIIGDYDEYTKNQLLKINPHLIFTGKIPHHEVIDHLKRSKVYCQFSMIESFGVGIGESISCDCIPVVLDNGAMKEIVVESGIVTTKHNALESVKKALNTTIKSTHKNYIINKFSSFNRRIKLFDIVNR